MDLKKAAIASVSQNPEAKFVGDFFEDIQRNIPKDFDWTSFLIAVLEGGSAFNFSRISVTPLTPAQACDSVIMQIKQRHAFEYWMRTNPKSNGI